MNAINSLFFEIKNLHLQIARINNLRKAEPGSIEHTAFLYAEKSRVRSNLKRIILFSAILFIVLISVLIISTLKLKVIFITGIQENSIALYIIGIVYILTYLLIIAKALSEPIFDDRTGKLIYRSYWLLFYVFVIIYAVLSNSEHFIINELNEWICFIPIIAIIPILNLIESIFVIVLQIAVIVFACFSSQITVWYNLLFAIPIILIIITISQSIYIEHMDILYTKFSVQQRGYKIQKRFEGIIADLFDEVYEISLNTNEITLLHNKGTYKPSEMKNSYGESIEYIAQNLLHPDDVDLFINKFLTDSILEKFKSGTSQIYHEARWLNMDGNYAWVALLLIREETNSSDDFTLMWLLEDIDRRKLSEVKLKTEAQMDALTQLCNKVTTKRMIEEYLKSIEGMNGSHAFVIVDMDNFKAINDNLGHFVGDAVLLAFSSELKSTFRETDIIGRIGGDEFVVFIKNVQSVALVCDKVQRLTSGFKKYGLDHNIKYKLSTSIGISIYDKDGKNYDELYRSADSALYESKRNGKDQYKFCIRDNNN